MRLACLCRELSIPLWCDWDKRRGGPGRAGALLSIPLWCDWDAQRVWAGEVGSLAFNPTVVRLGQAMGRLSPCLGVVFQSHCGAIGTGRADEEES